MTAPDVLVVERVFRRFHVGGGAGGAATAGGESAGVVAVADVSFSLRAGEVLGIVGESGSGKTTLGRLLVHLLRPTSGRILLEGVDVASLSPEAVRRRLRPKVRMVFQDPDAALNPAYTIGDGLRRAIAIHRRLTEEEGEEAVRELLARVGMDASYGEKYPDELSGGEKRRVGICRALLTDPAVIVADEPLSGLDVVLQERVLELLMAEHKARGFAMVLISHDLDRVNQVCDRVLVMLRGRVVEELRLTAGEGEPPYRHPYSVSLYAARDPWAAGRAARPHRTPVGSGGAVGAGGCAVTETCPVRRVLGKPVRCVDEVPALVQIGEGQSVACHFAEQLAAVG